MLYGSWKTRKCHFLSVGFFIGIICSLQKFLAFIWYYTLCVQIQMIKYFNIFICIWFSHLLSARYDDVAAICRIWRACTRTWENRVPTSHGKLGKSWFLKVGHGSPGKSRIFIRKKKLKENENCSNIIIDSMWTIFLFDADKLFEVIKIQVIIIIVWQGCPFLETVRKGSQSWKRLEKVREFEGRFYKNENHRAIN